MFRAAEARAHRKSTRMPQSTELSTVDAKPGDERIFNRKKRVHVEFHRMPQSTEVLQTDAKNQKVKRICLSYEKREIIPVGNE